jgi:hypothetical protein
MAMRRAADNECSERAPVPSGHAYRAEFAGEPERVTAELAAELRRVLERFAEEAGATCAKPVRIGFGRGIFGHHQVGRAADIYAVNGLRLDGWKQRWDAAHCQARAARTRLERRLIVETEQKRNLGWRLYKALQMHGRWAQPYGYPIQLFGPWTREEGPWRYISNFLLHAHRDHIHLAK